MSERTEADTFGLKGIGQIMMPVEDLGRAIEFYRDALGLPFLFQVPGMAFFDLEGIRLMLGEGEEGAGAHLGSILYYRVSDIEKAHESLAGRGVDFNQAPTRIAEMEDHDLWMAFFHDSEGNQLALMAEVGRG